MLLSAFSLLFGESKTGTKNIFCIKCADMCVMIFYTQLCWCPDAVDTTIKLKKTKVGVI